MREWTGSSLGDYGGGVVRNWLVGGPGRRYRVFEAAPQDPRGMPAKKPVADYFLVSAFLASSFVIQIV